MTEVAEVKQAKGTKWNDVVFWTPVEVAEFLSTLTPYQSSAAKVIHFEVKILVLYPNA
jgi:hypothetical protein